jgi:hypothetical protein
MHIVSLVGDAMKRTVAPADEPSFPRAGVFLLETAETDYCIWVRPSNTEGSTWFLEGDQLSILKGMIHRVDDLPPGTGAEQRFRVVHAGGSMSLFLPFLLLAMASWLAESWVESAGQPFVPHSVEGTPAL